MNKLIGFLSLVLVWGCLFASQPARAGMNVYFNANDRFIVNGSTIIAMPNTPVIENGVIYNTEPLISESQLRQSLFNGAAMTSPQPVGLSVYPSGIYPSLIYRGVVYQPTRQ